jgi:hypothetical protein
MTMTTSQETMTDAARRSQEAMTSAMQSYLDMFVPDSDTKLHDAVDKMYDCAEQMLITQRQFAKGWLDFYMSAASKTAYAAHDAAKNVEYAAKDMEHGANSQRQTEKRSAKDTDAASKRS